MEGSNMSRSITRQRMAAFLAPATLGLCALGQMSLVHADHVECCPPALSEPCQPGDIFLPAEVLAPEECVPSFQIENSNMNAAPSSVPQPQESSESPSSETSPSVDVPTNQEDYQDFGSLDSQPSNVDLSSGLASNFGRGGASALAFSDALSGSSSVGYIDSAIVRNQVRLRVDASFDNPTPDRAEFFYPQCGCFGPHARGPGETGVPETGVDYQEISLYAESLLMGNTISGFVEIPFRLINPEVVDNTAGLSDISFGLRANLLRDCNRALTFQFRTFVPTGDGSRGLGMEHVTLEPGLLFMRRFNSGTTIEGEIRDYIPIDGTDGYAGNVLRYGLGISRTLFDNGRLAATPVFETVAWSVLSGDVLTSTGLESAETTIVNAKFGTRFDLKPHRRCGATQSLYVGYGTALTDDVWYEDTIRAEYRYAF